MLNEKAISHLLSRKETRLALCERDLVAFWVYYFLPSVKYSLAVFHYQMCDDMMSDKNCLFDMFRESWKTFWAKVKFIHNIVYRKKRFMMYYCADKRKASAHMFDMSVMLTTNRKIKADFGMILSKKKMTFDDDEDEMPTKKTVSEFITKNYVRCKAMSIGESPRGEQYMTQDGTFRPDFAIIDDADILKNVRNKEIITKNEEWFNDELMWGLSDDSQIVFLGNTILKDWLVPRVRIAHQDDPDWIVRRIPLVWPSGKITWPERYNQADIDKKKRKLGTTAFNRSMLLIPGTPGWSIFKKSWIRWTSHPPVWSYIVIWIDPAHSTKTKSDELWITVTLHVKEGDIIYRYILESYGLAWDEKHESRSIPFMVWLYIKWNASLFRIETNNGWEFLWRSLQTEHCAVEFITQVKDKETRALEYQADVEIWRVFFIAGWWENSKLVEQITSFPDVPHDDRMDSMVNSFTDEIPNNDIFIA